MYCFLHLGFINVIIFVNNPSRSYSAFVGADLEYPISLIYIRSSWSELRYFSFEPSLKLWCTASKMKFPIKDFFSKCNQIRRKPRIWSQLLKKFLMENFIFLCSDGVVLEILTNSGDFRRVSGFFKELFKFWNFKSLSFCVHHHLRHYLQLLEYMSKTTVRVY